MIFFGYHGDACRTHFFMQGLVSSFLMLNSEVPKPLMRATLWGRWLHWNRLDDQFVVPFARQCGNA